MGVVVGGGDGAPVNLLGGEGGALVMSVVEDGGLRGYGCMMAYVTNSAEAAAGIEEAGEKKVGVVERHCCFANSGSGVWW